MAIYEKDVTLPSQSPGASHRLISYTFSGRSGSHARTAYIQAGLHADEHPGLLVIQHLLTRLQALDDNDQILGRIVVRPFANPVGMGQRVFGHLAGRFNLDNGENYNRFFPDITEALRENLAKEPVPHNDVAEVKRRFATLMAPLRSPDTVGAGKHHLLSDAFEHDLVLDLHCDSDAALHLYSTTNQAERSLRLSRCLGIEAIFLEDDSSNAPFDEAYSNAWRVVQNAGVVDADNVGFSCTVELRGQADINDELAAADAEGILRFLAEEGVIEAELEAPTHQAGEPQIYPLTGVAPVKATTSGIVVYKKALGEPVHKGDVVAEVVPLDQGINPPREKILSPVDGVMVVRHLIKLVRPGQRLALLAGKEPLPDRKGNLLGD